MSARQRKSSSTNIAQPRVSGCEELQWIRPSHGRWDKSDSQPDGVRAAHVAGGTSSLQRTTEAQHAHSARSGREGRSGCSRVGRGVLRCFSTQRTLVVVEVRHEEPAVCELSRLLRVLLAPVNATPLQRENEPQCGVSPRPSKPQCIPKETCTRRGVISLGTRCA